MLTRFALLMLLTLLGTGTVAAAEAGLRVGAAKMDETGAFGASQSGKYDHEHVYARAIVLDNGTGRAVLISYDGPSSDFDMLATRRAVATQLHCALESVLISHTHTHSASSSPMGTPGVDTVAAGTQSKSILDAVRAAQANLQPARMGFGTGQLSLSVNRDAIDPTTRKWTQGSNLDAVSDKTVAVLTFERPDGRPIAAYVNYAMHPIDGYVLGVVSGDFPEAMSRYVEKAFGDQMVVAFTQGASGDQNPLYLRPSTDAMATRAGNPITGFDMNREASEGPLRLADMAQADHGAKPAPAADRAAIERLFSFIDSEGQIFGEEVIRVMTLTTRMSDDARIESSQQTVSCPGRERTNGNPFDPKTREGQGAVYADRPPVQIHVGLLGIGNVAVASVNGEIYTRIGEEAKEAAPMKHTFITTLANETVPGYMPDDESYGHESFQVLDSRLKPGCAEVGITNAIVNLETAYLRPAIAQAATAHGDKAQ